MSEFEQQIAEVLAQLIRVVDGDHSLGAGKLLGDRLAPRVVAAIIAANRSAHAWDKVYDPKRGIVNWESAALAALRGEAS